MYMYCSGVSPKATVVLNSTIMHSIVLALVQEMASMDNLTRTLLKDTPEIEDRSFSQEVTESPSYPEIFTNYHTKHRDHLQLAKGHFKLSPTVSTIERAHSYCYNHSLAYTACSCTLKYIVHVRGRSRNQRGGEHAPSRLQCMV